ncbi:AraC family transcriptional regulator [Parahaliea mediterranea]|uniref:AraC family transcriptional regulator n=1 Tax=Parahaliea mediterranea TaxID=651086 RepID=A0A939DH31_9GAMM|nr:AraC family transcriptional regulator [Parahaliea mediterranea]MBN7798010.1 AraC family transcriptional regulator [Parahaliea mediterranea]
MPHRQAEPGQAPTVLCSWTKVLVLALRDHGCDADALVAGAGLSLDQLAAPDARLPLAATTDLWREGVRAVGDESLGLWVPRYSSQTTFHALGYAFMASSTLLEALRRVARFNVMVSDAARVELHCDDRSVTMSWYPLAPELGPALEAMEAILSLILRSCRKIKGRDFAPEAVELMRGACRDEQPFLEFFRAPVAFGAPRYSMRFERATLEQALEWGNEDLARSNDRVVEDYLQRLELGSVATRLRGLLVRELPGGAQGHEHYARALGMSGRSLQRKLSAEGTSFNQLLNDTRLELARAYLGQEPRQSLTEIAFLLGFADTSSFSRAFHRWTGVSPGAYAS